jgi:hypothetical protein
VAIKVSVLPTSRDSVFLFKVTLVTGTVDEAGLTVTVQIAVLLPSSVVT